MTEVFTPGPWLVEFQEEWPFDITIKPDVAVLRRYAYGTKDTNLEDVRRANSFDWNERDEISAKVAEQEANAHLIASAPDLLQALEMLLEFVEAHTAAGEVIPPHTVEHVRSREAIAKARGEA